MMFIYEPEYIIEIENDGFSEDFENAECSFCGTNFDFVRYISLVQCPNCNIMLEVE